MAIHIAIWIATVGAAATTQNAMLSDFLRSRARSQVANVMRQLITDLNQCGNVLQLHTGLRTVPIDRAKPGYIGHAPLLLWSVGGDPESESALLG